MARAVPRNDESPKQSTQPVRNQQTDRARPVGATWCLSSCQVVRTTNQSETNTTTLDGFFHERLGLTGGLGRMAAGGRQTS
jgi:hypothetical protein